MFPERFEKEICGRVVDEIVEKRFIVPKEFAETEVEGISRLFGISDADKPGLKLEIYRRTVSFCEKLVKKGYLKRSTGLLRYDLDDHGLDNLDYLFALLKKGAENPDKMRSIKRMCKQKLKALAILSMENLDIWTKLEYIRELFLEYLREVEQKEAELRNKGRKVKYWCRFEREYTEEQKRRIRKMFKKAEKLYNVGVFLVLTTDPKRFKDPIEALMSIFKNFNAFMSWVAKRVGFRPPYICVLEFHGNWCPHLHVFLFGVERIADFEEIREEWSRLGQGEDVWVVSSRFVDGRWIPKDGSSKAGDLPGYLGKWLDWEERMFDEIEMVNVRNGSDSSLVKEILKRYFTEMALLWVTNKRFFTASRCLIED